jgi:ComF family protein
MALKGICGNCLKSPPDFSRVYAPFIYGAPVDRLVLSLKHHRQLAAAEVLGDLMVRHLTNLPLQGVDVLLPMPLHWRRRFGRGYNQARELARVVSKQMGIPVDSTLARRTRHTAMQQQINRKHRRRNLRNAFMAEASCQHLRVAVIDDVMTTGSTARELASTLIKAGAADVQIWCVARTALEN